MSNPIILSKVISEKSFAFADATNVYCFYVDNRATKIDVKIAVEKEYKVKVKTVNMLNRPGKSHTDMRKNIKRRNSDRKKAIVTLKKGEAIKEFTKI